jgi:hypothetical protein
MDKIEFYMDEETPLLTGWYINSYDKLGEPPYDCVGPYETKTEALRVWRDTTPHRKTDNPETEPSDAGHEV